jgi:hypothetical protein
VSFVMKIHQLLETEHFPEKPHTGQTYGETANALLLHYDQLNKQLSILLNTKELEHIGNSKNMIPVPSGGPIGVKNTPENQWIIKRGLKLYAAIHTIDEKLKVTPVEQGMDERYADRLMDHILSLFQDVSVAATTLFEQNSIYITAQTKLDAIDPFAEGPDSSGYFISEESYKSNVVRKHDWQMVFNMDDTIYYSRKVYLNERPVKKMIGLNENVVILNTQLKKLNAI